MPGYRRGIRLAGSVVVVAGAAGTVGRATASALTRYGARPVLLGAPGDALDRTADACRVGVDLADADAVRAAAQQVVDRHGRLDAWVQCPPDVPSPAGALVELPPADVARTVADAVCAALHGARAALPLLAAGDGGVLVVVASVHGQVARPFDAPPGMAGAALRVLAAALRQELRLTGVRGVAVTTVLAPERRSNADVPVWRPARPEAVAEAVVGRLRHPGLEKVAGGPLVTALVHGHALAPGLTEWLVARGSTPRRG